MNHENKWNEIKDFLNSKGKMIFDIPDISFAYLAGSIIRGEFHKQSDVDLFISVPNVVNLTSKEKYQLIQEILIRTDPIKYPIDVTILENLRLDIQLRVFQEGVCIYETNPKERMDYIASIMTRAYDYNIWLEKYTKLALKE